jgi:subtilase family serine protease
LKLVVNNVNGNNSMSQEKKMIRYKKINLSKVFMVLLVITLFITSINCAFGLPNSVPVCGKEASGHVRCMSYVTTNAQGKVVPAISPSVGYGPNNFLSAYNLGTGITNKNKIIAIIDAYDQPNIFSDLNTYSDGFGISRLNQCTVSSTTSSCFQKVDQRGGTNYPISDLGWGLEISLDVEVAHAICRNCNILLVEADSSSYTDMLGAFDRAVAMGADVISNSYGSSEFSSETSYDSHFNLPGKAITFSSGDSGYGATYPAASPYVTSVGGTTLQSISPHVETVWSGSGSGCSMYESKPSFQKDTGCGTKRTIADISADADPGTGAVIYDSSYGGWLEVGGTSLSSPIIAGVYALGKGFSGYGNSVPYTNGSYRVNLYDITSGSNGICGGSYLCTGATGYDGPTGLGSPIGTGAFETPQTGVIGITSPNGGENWLTGSTHTISWNYSINSGSKVEIDLYKGGLLNKVLATGVSIGSGWIGTYTWNIDSATKAGSDYKIKVTTDKGVTDMSDAVFTISATPTASITITSPKGGESWQIGSTNTISWSYIGKAGSTVKIDLLVGGSLYRNIASGISIGSLGKGSYRWRIGQYPNGNNYQVRITTNTGYISISKNFRIRR